MEEEVKIEIVRWIGIIISGILGYLYNLMKNSIGNPYAAIITIGGIIMSLIVLFIVVYKLNS